MALQVALLTLETEPVVEKEFQINNSKTISIEQYLKINEDVGR